jgi:hypothetical protein
MLNADEDEAEVAYERVTRILDLCREDTDYDIERGEAERMARVMREHMERRADSEVPMTEMLTADDERRDIGLPLTLREFEALAPFEPIHFRDFRDEDGQIVHSLGSYLTVWSSLTTVAELQQNDGGDGQGQGQSGQNNDEDEGDEGGDEGADEEPPPSDPDEGNNDLNQQGQELTGGSFGYGININTAPAAVLKALFDSRELNPRFWDEVIRYRNEEEEEEEDEEEAVEPVYNELGEEIVPMKIFDAPSELAEVDGWLDLEGAIRRQVNDLVLTQSRVFSIYITAIKLTGADEVVFVDAEDTVDEFENSQGNQLVRTIRMVYWRRPGEEEAEMVPIVRWEVVDYVPFEVLDFPDEDR